MPTIWRLPIHTVTGPADLAVCTRWHRPHHLAPHSQAGHPTTSSGKHDRAGVHHTLRRHAANRGFVVRAIARVVSVNGVFQFHQSDYLAHSPLPNPSAPAPRPHVDGTSVAHTILRGGRGWPIHLIGVEFSKETRTLVGFEAVPDQSTPTTP